jgi:hypothetical protein
MKNILMGLLLGAALASGIWWWIIESGKQLPPKNSPYWSTKGVQEEFWFSKKTSNNRKSEDVKDCHQYVASRYSVVENDTKRLSFLV